MAMNLQCTAICSGSNYRYGWALSSCSTCGTTTFTPSRNMGRGLYLYGEMNGRQWPSAYPACQAHSQANDQEALIRGYAVQHFQRPYAFIGMKLSPRTRKEARRWLGHGEGALFTFLAKVFKDRHDGGEWLRKVAAADYMGDRRREYVRYVATGIANDNDVPESKRAQVFAYRNAKCHHAMLKTA